MKTKEEKEKKCSKAIDYVAYVIATIMLFFILTIPGTAFFYFISLIDKDINMNDVIIINSVIAAILMICALNRSYYRKK